MIEKKERILINLAWPYANGDLHLGHIAAFLPGDILARYFRLKGKRVLFVSGSDCYGTPIALRAKVENIPPNQIAEKYHQKFVDLFKKIGFTLDKYSKTTSNIHSDTAHDIFTQLYEKKTIVSKFQKALYSEDLKRFLPDRFVEGICPICDFGSARGDQCDNCGSILESTDLISPRINKQLTEDLGGQNYPLTIKDTQHFFLMLSKMQDEVESVFLKNGHQWRANARGTTKGYLKEGLRDRAITRDIDWGVKIPLNGFDEKRLYVWFEAVCGYISASKLWAEENASSPDEWKKFWSKDFDVKHYYVHGKDNIPFHTIILPAMLANLNYKQPDFIVSSEYLNLYNKQFSKSRNCFVAAENFVEYFSQNHLRYYLCVAGPEKADSNFTWAGFQEKVNGELVGNLGNFIHRIVSLIHRYFPEGVSSNDADYNEVLVQHSRVIHRDVGEYIENTEFRKAFNSILRLAQEGNRLLSDEAPWSLLKSQERSDHQKAKNILYAGAIYVHYLGILLSPFLPNASQQIADIMDLELADSWEFSPQINYKITKKPVPIFSKIEDSEIEEQEGKLNMSFLNSDGSE